MTNIYASSYHPVLFVITLCVRYGDYQFIPCPFFLSAAGNPYCCPYPGSVIVAMIMEVLRRTTSRFLLLMICLGYGITRVQ